MSEQPPPRVSVRDTVTIVATSSPTHPMPRTDVGTDEADQVEVDQLARDRLVTSTVQAEDGVVVCVGGPARRQLSEHHVCHQVLDVGQVQALRECLVVHHRHVEQPRGHVQVVEYQASGAAAHAPLREDLALQRRLGCRFLHG